MKNLNDKIFYIILREFFYAVSGALIIFSFLEVFWNNVVLSFLDMNLVLIIWIINGILLLVMGKRDK